MAIVCAVLGERYALAWRSGPVGDALRVDGKLFKEGELGQAARKAPRVARDFGRQLISEPGPLAGK